MLLSSSLMVILSVSTLKKVTWQLSLPRLSLITGWSSPKVSDYSSLLIISSVAMVQPSVSTCLLLPISSPHDQVLGTADHISHLQKPYPGWDSSHLKPLTIGPLLFLFLVYLVWKIHCSVNPWNLRCVGHSCLPSFLSSLPLGETVFLSKAGFCNL